MPLFRPGLPFAMFIFALSLLAAPSGARAEEEVGARPAEVEGGKDHPRIPRYPGAILEQYSHKEFEEYDLHTKRENELVTTTKVEGLGESKPVGDNKTEDGRALNRRVGVWARVDKPFETTTKIDLLRAD